MAFVRVVIAWAIVAAMVQVNPACAKDILVGDEFGWTINCNYQAWAQGKEFNVGDRLVFNYTKGVHNVVKVDGAGFQKCAVPNGAVPLTSGNDVISLAAPGKEWYICGVPGHCAFGMKLAINVSPNNNNNNNLGSPASPPSLSPVPAGPAAHTALAPTSFRPVLAGSAAHPAMAPRFFACMVAAFGVILLII